MANHTIREVQAGPYITGKGMLIYLQSANFVNFFITRIPLPHYLPLS